VAPNRHNRTTAAQAVLRAAGGHAVAARAARFSFAAPACDVLSISLTSSSVPGIGYGTMCTAGVVTGVQREPLHRCYPSGGMLGEWTRRLVPAFCLALRRRR
jgi:hypothetical protein